MNTPWEVVELLDPESKGQALLLQYRHFVPRWAAKLQREGRTPRPDKADRFFGVFSGQSLVGAIRLNTNPLKAWRDSGATYAYIRDVLKPEVAIACLVVDPDYRRRGIGRALRERVQQEYQSILTGYGAKSNQEAMEHLNRTMGFRRFWGSADSVQFYWTRETDRSL